MDALGRAPLSPADRREAMKAVLESPEIHPKGIVLEIPGRDGFYFISELEGYESLAGIADSASITAVRVESSVDILTYMGRLDPRRSPVEYCGGDQDSRNPLIPGIVPPMAYKQSELPVAATLSGKEIKSATVVYQSGKTQAVDPAILGSIAHLRYNATLLDIRDCVQTPDGTVMIVFRDVDGKERAVAVRTPDDIVAFIRARRFADVIQSVAPVTGKSLFADPGKKS